MSKTTTIEVTVEHARLIEELTDRCIMDETDDEVWCAMAGGVGVSQDDLEGIAGELFYKAKAAQKALE